MQKYNRLFFLAFLITAVFLAGCSHYPQNQPLGSASCMGTYDFHLLDSPDNGDETFVVLTFSGGGDPGRSIRLWSAGQNAGDPHR